MKWARSQFPPEAHQRIVERLTAIRLHAGAVRRRLRRPDPAGRAEALDHLDAIDEHVDAAAAEAKALGERRDQ